LFSAETIKTKVTKLIMKVLSGQVNERHTHIDQVW